MENYIVINGKKAELTPEQIKALGIEVEKPNPFARELLKGDVIYCISEIGEVAVNYNEKSVHSGMLYSVGNYCTDKNLMQQRAYRETLNRLLWRYSMEHDGDKIKWGIGTSDKCKIYFDHDSDSWQLDCNNINENFGCVYFYNNKIAQNAIKEIIKPFMNSHPDFKL